LSTRCQPSLVMRNESTPPAARLFRNVSCQILRRWNQTRTTIPLVQRISSDYSFLPSRWAISVSIIAKSSMNLLEGGGRRPLLILDRHSRLCHKSKGGDLSAREHILHWRSSVAIEPWFLSRRPCSAVRLHGGVRKLTHSNGLLQAHTYVLRLHEGKEPAQ